MEAQVTYQAVFDRPTHEVRRSQHFRHHNQSSAADYPYFLFTAFIWKGTGTWIWLEPRLDSTRIQGPQVPSP